MIHEEFVRNLIEDRIAGTSCFLVDLKIDQSNNIIVELDNDKGISIDDCVSVSRAIEGNIDREENDFSLKVTSPGADQPLKVWRQYHKNIGRSLDVTMTDGKTISGKLISATEDSITIEIKPAKSKDKPVPQQIQKNQIKQSKIILSFK
jgi:ribosome maturation factor RimP